MGDEPITFDPIAINVPILNGEFDYAAMHERLQASGDGVNQPAGVLPGGRRIQAAIDLARATGISTQDAMEMIEQVSRMPEPVKPPLPKLPQTVSLDRPKRKIVLE